MFVQTGDGYVLAPTVVSSSATSSSSSWPSSNEAGGVVETKKSAPVTNTSILHVRASEDDQCPNIYQYQWYRSKSYCCNSTSPRGFGGGGGCGDNRSNEIRWHKLCGATHALYQPSAVDVGKKLRCVVHYLSDDSSSNRSSSSNSSSSINSKEPFEGEGKCGEENDVGEEQHGGKQQRSMTKPNTNTSTSTSTATTTRTKWTIISNLILRDPVSADDNLFNAARGNLSGGSVFRNIMGRGPAEGREFRLKINLGWEQAGGIVSAHLMVFQVSESIAANLCGDNVAIPNVSASVSDPSNARYFEILLPSTRSSSSLSSSLPPTGGMVDALSVGRKFKLMAPTRVSRESLLLTLGIANFKGEPSELTSSTVLFHDDDDDDNDDFNDYNNDGDDVGLLYGQVSRESKLGTAMRGDDGRGGAAAAPNASKNERSKAIVPISSSAMNDTTGKLNQQTQPAKNSHHILAAAAAAAAHQDVQNEILKNDRRLSFLESELGKMSTVLNASKRRSSDLEMLLERSGQEREKRERDVVKLQMEWNAEKERHRRTFAKLKLAEQRIENHDSVVSQVKKDYSHKITLLEEKVAGHEEQSLECDDIIQSLREEVSTLVNAVHERDLKLNQMEEIQGQNSKLTEHVKKGERAQKELNTTRSELSHVRSQLTQIQKDEKNQKLKLHKSNTTLLQTSKQLHDATNQMSKLQFKVDKLQHDNHKLCTERNNLRQKAESLSKEMSKLCRHHHHHGGGSGGGGMTTIADMERVLEEYDKMKKEIKILQQDKKGLTVKLEETKLEYERALQEQQQQQQLRGRSNGTSTTTTSISDMDLERRSELECVITNLTEYLNAKEMQLDTMREVNRALTEELQEMQQQQSQCQSNDDTNNAKKA